MVLLEVFLDVGVLELKLVVAARTAYVAGRGTCENRKALTKAVPSNFAFVKLREDECTCLVEEEGEEEEGTLPSEEGGTSSCPRSSTGEISPSVWSGNNTC